MRSVVVTGMGMLSPLGLTMEQTWANIVAGKSGVAPITLFDTAGFDTRFAAEVKGFDPIAHMDRKVAHRADRFTQLAVAAAFQAIEDARLPVNEHNRDRVGVIVGSGIGGLRTLSEAVATVNTKGPRRVSALAVPMFIPDMAAGQISILIGAWGPNFATVSACSSSANALGEAAQMIRHGMADAIVAVGTEAPIVPVAVAAFNSMHALSERNDSPETASRPFDATRDGFVMAEGAATLILEAEEVARARGASILARLAGYGTTADASHITAPAERGRGAAEAMRLAICRAGLQPADVDYINAHGTGTDQNDKAETEAVKDVFGEHAYKLAISSTKSMIGHTLGAAGATEAAFTILAMRDGMLPPTINLHHPDPDCDLDYVPNEARRQQVRVGLSNSLGFGGHNASLLFTPGD